MTTAQLRQFRLIIVPGGNFLTMGETLTPTTAAVVHDAVQDGLNYLGICAGAFLAGQASYPSLNLTSGAHFEFYAAARDGTRKTNVLITTPVAPPRNQSLALLTVLPGLASITTKALTSRPTLKPITWLLHKNY